MSTRIHPKYVRKNSPKKRTYCGQKCQWVFTKSVHKNSPFLSTKICHLCPREVCNFGCTSIPTELSLFTLTLNIKYTIVMGSYEISADCWIRSHVISVISWPISTSRKTVLRHTFGQQSSQNELFDCLPGISIQLPFFKKN